MIFGSVCSGIEAASVAWQPLGWRAAFFSEIDAFPRAVLKHHGADKTVSTATETNLAGSVRTKPPGSIENSSTTAVMQGMAVRRLTPRECERLQGFPDDYTAVPYRGKMAADGPRYKALGNSMAVPCMRWIGDRDKQGGDHAAGGATIF